MVLEIYLDCLCKEIVVAEKNNEYYEILDRNILNKYTPINHNNKKLVDIILYTHLERTKTFYTPKESIDELILGLKNYKQLPLPEFVRLGEGRVNKNMFNTRMAQRHNLKYEKDAIDINRELINALIWVK